MVTRAVLFDVGCVLIHPQERHFCQAVYNALRWELPKNRALPALSRTVWTGASSVDPVAFWAGDGKSRAWAAHVELLPESGPLVWQALEALDTPEDPLWSNVDRDARQTLESLRSAGLLIAAVSNSDGRLHQNLREAGIADLFDAMLDSADEGIAKPDRRIFERAAGLLAVPLSSCLFVGDDPHFDIAGSLKAGAGKAVLLDTYELRPKDWIGTAIGSLNFLKTLAISGANELNSEEK